MAVAVAVGLRTLLQDYFDTAVTYIPFVATVTVVAVGAGGGAGVLATILSAVTIERLASGSVTAGEALAMGLFVASGLVVSATAEMLHRARRREVFGLEVEVAERARNLEAANARLRCEIAERARTEAALREGQDLFRLFIEHAPAPLAMFDREMRYLAASRRWIDSYSLGDQDIIGRSHYEVFPDLPERWKGVHRRSLAGEAMQAEEDRFDRADGSVQWLRWVVRPWQAADGTIGGILIFSEDITERKQTEEALREKAVLEEEDRRKDVFLATLGHELRNPLAALDLELRLLAEGEGDTNRIQHRMGSHVQQLTQLVNDLLDVSRIKRGKPVLRKVRTDLVALVRSAAAAVKNDVRRKRQELVFSLPVSLHVEGDPTRLEQVVANLLSNATKYTHEDGRIEVSVLREQGEAVICVRDNGRGLRLEQVESLFEPFTQADPLAGGLGIGLALVKGLVAQHGGSVEAESEGPGCGSRFTIRVPVGDAGVAVPLPSERTRVRQLPRAVRVLVVDDMPETAELLVLLLRRMGADAVCAYSGTDGLEKARTWRPEVALVDVGLPDISGYEVARGIRAQKGGEGVLLLAVTGFGDAGSEAKARLAGFDERLLKPFPPEVLYEQIAKRPGPAPPCEVSP